MSCVDRYQECPICLKPADHTHDKTRIICVDLDGTLANHDNTTIYSIGTPIPEMVDRVRRWISEGYQVVIFTARLTQSTEKPRNIEAMRLTIESWCRKNIGMTLHVTSEKPHRVIAFWDDKAVRC